MSVDTSSDAAAARDAAAHELVGCVRVLLQAARRDDHGWVTVELGRTSLALLVETYNRATCSDTIEAADVGR